MVVDSETKSATFSPVPAKKWLEDFQDPPATYRLVPFWSWNEKMEPEEVKRQVRVIKQGGWGGAFVHSRIGLTTPYLGDDWFKAVDATLEACEPSGFRLSSSSSTEKPLPSSMPWTFTGGRTSIIS